MHKAALHHFTYRSKKVGVADNDDADLFSWRAEKSTCDHRALCLIGARRRNYSRS